MGHSSNTDSFEKFKKHKKYDEPDEKRGSKKRRPWARNRVRDWEDASESRDFPSRFER